MNAPGSNVLAGLKKDPVIRSSPADRNAVSIPHTGVKKIEGAAGRTVKTGNRTSERVVKSTKRGLPQPLKIKEYDPPEKAAQLAARAPGMKVHPIPFSSKAEGARHMKKSVPTVLRRLQQAAQTLMRGLAAGGGTVVLVVLTLSLVGALIASPFGLFFSNVSGGHTVSETVSQLNREFAERLEELQTAVPHDTLDLNSGAVSAINANWRNVLAVFAVRAAGDDAFPGNAAVLKTAGNSMGRRQRHYRD